MAFKSLHNFNLETFRTEVLLTLASITLANRLAIRLRKLRARHIRSILFYAIAADRRTRVQHLFPKPKSSILMSSHLSENSGVAICEIRKTVGQKRATENVKPPWSE
jgi:hypothetical protein